MGELCSEVAVPVEHLAFYYQKYYKKAGMGRLLGSLPKVEAGCVAAANLPSPTISVFRV